MTSIWRRTTIGGELKLQYGKSLAAATRRVGSVPVYGSNGQVGVHDEACVDGPGIIVGRKGSAGAVTFSAAAFWPIDTTYFVENTALHDWRFLYHLLSSLGLGALDNLGPVPGLNRDDAYGVTVDLPALLEQQQIAQVLDLVEGAIGIEQRLVVAARELKVAAMRQLFTSGICDAAGIDSEIGTVPANWELVSVRSVAKLIAGGTPARGEPRYWSGGTIPWVKTGEIDYRIIRQTEEHITAHGLTESAAKLLPAGTVLVAMYGQGVTRGRVAILGLEATTNQACVGLLPTEGRIISAFLFQYLAYSYDRLRAASHGAQQQNLNAELVGSFCIPLPPIDEQAEIVTILSAIDERLTHHEHRHSLLTELFGVLLTDLMSGRIRVADLDLSALGAAGA